MGNAKKNELEIPPENPPGWWYELDNQEQWAYFRDMSIEYVKIDSIMKEKKDISNKLKNQLKKSNDFLKSYSPFYPTWGMSLNLTLLCDSSLSFDMVVGMNFHKYFFKGRIFICPGLSIKYNKDILNNKDSIGGGFNFGMGFNF